MHTESTAAQRDELLRGLLQLLARRGIAKRWAELPEPASALTLECQTIASNQVIRADFRSYFHANPSIPQTVDTLLAHLAMTSSVRWQDIQGIIQPLAKRGWHIARWLPTFLIIDGPLGRFLRDAGSPLNILLKKEHANYPVLAQARDTFNSELFRQVRNGVGHWSFRWEDARDGPHLIMINWETSQTTTTISLLEAEALHLVAYSVIEALNREIISTALKTHP